MDEKISFHLINLEKELLKSNVRSDPARIAQLLHDDFIEFTSSGNKTDKADVIKRLPNEKCNLQFTTRDFSARELCDDIVQITYEATITNADKNTSLKSLRSSLWKFEHSHWQMIFHQGTLTA